MVLPLLLMACQSMPSPRADVYKNWTDRWIVRLGLPIRPCQELDDIDECYRRLPAQHWRGTWVLGPGEHMEYFCPNSAACRWDKQPSYDLWWNRRVFTGRPQVGAAWGKRYAADFVGRRTAYSDRYFGPGDRKYLIVVDRLTSIRELGPSPKE
jgi:hypothetical protein